jgi:hypothetical protein
MERHPCTSSPRGYLPIRRPLPSLPRGSVSRTFTRRSLMSCWRAVRIWRRALRGDGRR